MLEGDASFGQSRGWSWGIIGGLFMPTGVPSWPHMDPFRLDSIITEKWRWLYPWDWQPSSLAHALLRPHLVTCTHLTGHRTGLGEKIRRAHPGERKQREVGGFYPHDAEVIIRPKRDY